MTLPTIVAPGYDGTTKDFLKAPSRPDGSVQRIADAVSIPSGTAADVIVGLVPFRKGARFTVTNSSFHAGNFGAATTTLNIGIAYSDNTNNTNDLDAFASLSTAPQSGGFVTIDEIEGMTLTTTGDGWLIGQLKAADADATANLTFNVLVAYG